MITPIPTPNFACFFTAVLLRRPNPSILLILPQLKKSYSCFECQFGCSQWPPQACPSVQSPAGAASASRNRVTEFPGAAPSNSKGFPLSNTPEQPTPTPLISSQLIP